MKHKRQFLKNLIPHLTYEILIPRKETQIQTTASKFRERKLASMDAKVVKSNKIS